MSDLPDLPPGWTWWRHSDPRGPLAEVSAGGFRGLGLWPHDSTDEVADLLERVRDAHDSILRAAIQAAADAAGVVLPEDYDPAEVLRDGVTAAPRWSREADGTLRLHLRGSTRSSAAVWRWQRRWIYDVNQRNHSGGAVGSKRTEAAACAAACEALGVPCPPIPPEVP